MSTILSFDTSTEACSVALLRDGLITSRFEIIPRQHSEKILPMIDQVLVEADISLSQLDAIAFGCGPGAFTGLRIATGVVQGLAFAADKPIIPVSSLAALAQQAYRSYGEQHVLASIDARMHEIYWGSYSLVDGVMALMDEEIVCDPGLASTPENELPWFGMGSGWSYAAAIRPEVSRFKVDVYPDSVDIATIAEQQLSLGNTVSAEQAMPVYLRNNVAKKRGEQ